MTCVGNDFDAHRTRVMSSDSRNDRGCCCVDKQGVALEGRLYLGMNSAFGYCAAGGGIGSRDAMFRATGVAAGGLRIFFRDEVACVLQLHTRRIVWNLASMPPLCAAAESHPRLFIGSFLKGFFMGKCDGCNSEHAMVHVQTRPCLFAE